MMAKINKHIVIVRTDLPGQSSMTPGSAQSILAVLAACYRRVDLVIVRNQADLQAVAAAQPDVALLGFKRLQGPAEPTPAWAAAFFGSHGINYTGSGHAAVALDLNKDLAKRAVLQAGLPTAAHVMARPGQFTAASLPLALPLFIKPPTQGGGRGIAADSVARSFAQYAAKVQQIYDRYHTPALVETYLEGREFSVAMLQADDGLLALPIELIALPDGNGDRILGSQEKAADTEQVAAVPAGALRRQLQALARHAFQALGGRDYGRIDIRLDSSGAPHFLEANLLPGLSTHGYMARACRLNQGMSYSTMLQIIIATSLQRAETAAAADDITALLPSLLPRPAVA